MPRLSTEGSAVTGIAAGTIGIDGATPAALSAFVGGYWSWRTPDLVVGPGSLSGGPWRMSQYDTDAETLTEVHTEAANFAAAGGGIFVLWSALTGVKTSVSGFGPFPNARLLDVSETGLVALVRVASSASILDIYDATGTLVRTVNTTLTSMFVSVREGVVAYEDAAGWHLVNVTTGQPVTGFVARPLIRHVIPFQVGSTLSVAEYDMATDQWSIRPASGAGGFTVDTGGEAFNIDIIGLNATEARMAWATTEGEDPGDLVLLDINTATGTTTRWTVVGGTLVSASGPALEGVAFATINSARFYPPVRHGVLDHRRTGLLSEPWQSWARDIGQAVSGVQTTVAARTPSPANTGPGGVDTPSPSQTVAALDGTGSPGVEGTYARGDHKHGDVNRPTDDEKAALAGTDGTPSGANAYVTDSDPRLTGGGLPAHAATHQDGGGDEVDVTLLAGYPGGASTFLRDDGTFAAPDGGTPAAHAPTHEAGGGDAVDVTALDGFPGGTTDFLRADGSFAEPPGSGGDFYMSPVTTGGDPSTAELIFSPDGDVVMVPVDF